MSYNKIIAIIFLSIPILAMADIGDQNSLLNKNQSSFGSTNSTFGTSSYDGGSNIFAAGNANEDFIMDHHESDIPPENFDEPVDPSIPLDGGASLLLIGGAGLGLARLFRKKNGVNNE